MMAGMLARTPVGRTMLKQARALSSTTRVMYAVPVVTPKEVTSSSKQFDELRKAAEEAERVDKAQVAFEQYLKNLGPVRETYDPEQDPQLASMRYPKLPAQSRQLRSPYGWDDMQERANFGEQLHENDDVLSMWAPDAHRENPRSVLLQLMTMFAALGVVASFIAFSFPGRPNLPRAYPYDGLVRELSGTDEEAFAARPESANQIEDE